jgi:MFS superfamily sulfate permease-like transporter
MTADATKSRRNFVPDLIAGLTTGVANIPDAMASGVLAGANPVQGLYAIMIGTPLGAIFGRSAQSSAARRNLRQLRLHERGDNKE